MFYFAAEHSYEAMKQTVSSLRFPSVTLTPFFFCDDTKAQLH